MTAFIEKRKAGVPGWVSVTASRGRLAGKRPGRLDLAEHSRGRDARGAERMS